MPNDEQAIPFGRLLRECQIAAGATQEALAERTGLGVRSIQHLEGGEHLPRRETVARFIRALGLTGDKKLDFERFAQPLPRRQAALTRIAALPEVSRHNLPAQLTSFVGRERDVGDVNRLLSAHRLVTLVGTGGCGKSRLALHLAPTRSSTLSTVFGWWS